VDESSASVVADDGEKDVRMRGRRMERMEKGRGADGVSLGGVSWVTAVGAELLYLCARA
jgi:hypothetical protein